MGKKNIEKYGKYGLCVIVSVFLYMAAEWLNTGSDLVEKGVLRRNPCGQGEAYYEFSVEGLQESMFIDLYVPEQTLSEEEFRERIPEILQVILQRILGNNDSLQEVQSDLNLIKEIPEYGVEITWRSEQPQIIASDGSLYMDAFEGQKEVSVFLEAEVTNGIISELLQIPVVIVPPQSTQEERLRSLLENLVLRDRNLVEIRLPEEFEGMRLQYSQKKSGSDKILLVLGPIMTLCLILKEKEEMMIRRKMREEELMEAYPDFVYQFLILIGAGYSAKEAWKKLSEGYRTDGKKSVLFEEMQITVNQMETGVSEIRAYTEFGRRCGNRKYVKFASLLENSVCTGGKNLRKLLEAEVEDSFRIRTELAKRKGEEVSAKLLLPTFLMLGVVMVMVMAPAFLTIL